MYVKLQDQGHKVKFFLHLWKVLSLEIQTCNLGTFNCIFFIQKVMAKVAVFFKVSKISRSRGKQFKHQWKEFCHKEYT